MLYLGSRSPMDALLVRSAGIPFKGIFAGKLRRYWSLKNFDIFLSIIGFFQSLWICLRFWPDVVFSKGGYVSLPVVLAAFCLRRPIILHESDRVMGLANRLTARLASKVCVSFPEMVQGNSKMIYTGNPVRPEIQQGDPKKGYAITGFRPGRPVLLVWGGSQGSREINEKIEKELPRLTSLFQVIHITGEKNDQCPMTNDQCKSKINHKSQITNHNYVTFDYVDKELKDIYAITDFAVGRAGANSLAELALMRKPNVLIPLKNRDQLQNAAYFESHGASLILDENQSLFEVLNALWHNPEKQKSMKEALSGLAAPEAGEEIVKIILNSVYVRQ